MVRSENKAKLGMTSGARLKSWINLGSPGNFFQRDPGDGSSGERERGTQILKGLGAQVRDRRLPCFLLQHPIPGPR